MRADGFCKKLEGTVAIALKTDDTLIVETPSSGKLGQQ